jgi:hypothetical protein
MPARVLLFLLLAAPGCFLAVPPATSPTGGSGAGSGAAASATVVSFTDLEPRLAALLAETNDADRRDRLVALRELLYAMRGQDPASQAKVRTYVEAALAIEERGRLTSIPADSVPEGLGTDAVKEEAPAGGDAGTTPLPASTNPTPVSPATPAPAPETPAPAPETPVPQGAVLAPPAPDRSAVLDSTRSALAAGRYQDAILLLQPLDDGEARMLRQEAIDGFAKLERERAGTLFLDARKLPAGAERARKLDEAATALRAVNAAYPSNAYAAQIAANLSLVEAELQAGHP